jgi:drug/metabolite transporter (DMT)-like permease
MTAPSLSPPPATTPTPSRLPLIALLLGACAIGFGPTMMRLTETGPAAGAFWRLAFALPLLLVPALKEGGMVSGRSMRPGLFAGALFAIDLVAWHYAVAFTSVTNATVLSNTTPVVVTACAWFLFREKPTRAFLVSLVLALGGAVLMALAKGSGGHGTAPALGDLLALAAAVFYGSYFVVIRLARPYASTAQLMVWTSIGGAPIPLIAALLLGETLLPHDWKGWAACIGLGVMHATGQGLIAWALGRLPASLTSVTVLVQPVVAAALGWMIFSEAVVPLQALGALVLLAGVVLAQRSQRAKSAPAS